jgi:hypothetical protein
VVEKARRRFQSNRQLDEKLLDLERVELGLR